MVTYFYLVKHDADDGRWCVFAKGYVNPLSTFDAKDDAIDFARGLAEDRYVAEVHVFGAGDSIEARQEFRLAA